jgi:hypothetical protein
MYLTLLSSDKEKLIVEFVEIKAHTSGKTVNKGVFFII